MSQTIDVAFVKQFTDGITLLQQEYGGQLREGVSVEAGITGDRAFFDQIDSVEMSEVTNRHGDTPLTDVPHKRRMLSMKPFDLADMVDRPDLVRTLNDPTNSYVQAFARAAGRKEDKIIIDAFDAVASTGVDGAGSAAFDTTTSIAGNTGYEIAVNGSGLTTDKLITARAILEASSNMEGGEYQWFVVANAKARQGLLADTKFQDSDYNSIKALVHGEVDTWLGFKFLKSEQLPISASNRSIYAWCRHSMKLGVGTEPQGHIDVRPDKRHGTQIRYEMDEGAVRMDEKGVVRILCSEA